jgi:hypothetical protein
MTAPSKRHEVRRQALQDMAGMAGLTEPLYLGIGLNPDLARQRPGRRVFLVGDAKETETPGCAATWRRLRAYGVAIGDLVVAGGRGRLVLAVPDHDGRAVARWFDLLRDSTRMLPTATPCHTRVDTVTSLVWIDVAAPV